MMNSAAYKQIFMLGIAVALLGIVSLWHTGQIQSLEERIEVLEAAK